MSVESTFAARSIVKIANHSASQCDAGAGAERLHDAPADELPGIGRKGAAGRAEDEHDNALGHRAATAEPVADRPPKQLSEAEAEQVARDSELQQPSLAPRETCMVGKAGRNRSVEIDAKPSSTARTKRR